MTTEPVYVIAAQRTPVAKARGAFAITRPDDLLSHIIQKTVASVDKLDPALIGDVIIGCAMPEGAQGMNVARSASLIAGLPNTVPGMTVNRFCASGLQAVADAAQRIQLGEADVMLAGGVESMTMVPMGGYVYSPNLRWFREGHEDVAYSMGVTAENVAREYQISRQAQDAFALASHEKALSAQEAGYFEAEIAAVPVTINTPNLQDGTIVHHAKSIDKDEGPRKDSTLEALARLRTVFDAKGSVTAGNSSQMSDGAGAVLLASERFVTEHDITPLARFLGYRVAGVSPAQMGIGPIAAVPSVLQATGLGMEQLDWIELNEAFAAQALAVMKSLEMNPECVNPLGGAIALGHPLGATGAIRTATLLHGLKRTKKRYGMVTMCIGTGMGAAGVFEAV